MNYSEIGLVDSYLSKLAPLRKNNILIDVGAHEGGVSGFFARSGWDVIAFEPEENNRNQFLSNHSSNGKVICIPKAVTDKSGEKIPFYISDKHYGIHSIKPFHHTHQEALYHVETITLKDALEQNNIDHVSFLKVDIEGADFLALKGFDWSRIKPEIVMVEFMDDRSIKNFNYTHHDVASFMDDNGYACYVSEWEPIKEYGIKGQAGAPHRWIQCAPYPLDHEPSWGNLIFVPRNSKDKFDKALRIYLNSLIKAKDKKSKKSIILRIKIFIRTFFS